MVETNNEKELPLYVEIWKESSNSLRHFDNLYWHTVRHYTGLISLFAGGAGAAVSIGLLPISARLFFSASLPIEGILYKDSPHGNRLLVIALNMAAIVAYVRPFHDSKGELAHNRLPGKILRILNSEERELHEKVLKDRQTMVASFRC